MAIELQDNFTGILMNVISAVNMSASTIAQMRSVMNEPIDTASIEEIRDQLNRATIAAQELDAAIQNVDVSVADVQPSPVFLPAESSSSAPVEIPVVSQSHNLDVFTNTGIERFEMEVQGMNNMLNTLNQAQAEITTRAAQANIFPPDMVADMGGMQNRLQEIQRQIETIESDSWNMGVDTANAELERLQAQLDQVVQEQELMNRAVENMDIQAANEAYLCLSQTISNIEQYIRNNVDEQGKFNDEIREGVDSAADLKNMIASAVGDFTGMAGLKKVKSWIDDCTAAFNTQLNAEMQLVSVLANVLDEDYVAQFELEVAVDTVAAIGEIDTVQNGIDEVVVPVTATAETRTLIAAYDQITAKASEIQRRGVFDDEAMIAGAAELSTYFSDPAAIMYMMDTLSDYAMGMNVLDGKGLQVDSTSMARYATNLGKIMTGTYTAMSQKGLEFTGAQKAVIEGTATEGQIISALGEEYLSASSDMQAAIAITQIVNGAWSGLYESMSNTPEGKIIQMTNTLGGMKEVIGGQLYPYVLLFVDTITQYWPTIQTVLDKIIIGLQCIFGFLSWMTERALNFAQFFIDNWSWISPIIYGIAAAFLLYNGVLAAHAIACGISTVMEVLKGIQAYITASALLANVNATLLATSAEYAFVVAAAQATVAQGGFNTALAACPITWIILAIIALIVVIFVVCNAIADMTGIATSGFGILAGCINVVIQFFINLALAVTNNAIGMGYAIGALTSNMKTAFHNAIVSVQSWFYDLLSTALTVINDICIALNKLPFIEFDYSGISAAASDYAAKAEEIAGNKESYENILDAFNKGNSTFNTFQDGWVSNAFNAGAAWGDGIADKISNFNLSDLFDTTDILSADDYASALTAGGIGRGVDDIAENTGAIADAMDITAEELKYLRDIAEQETINRYTTAEISIEQTNHNTIKNGMDLDGIMSSMEAMVNEAIDISTEGVHA